MAEHLHPTSVAQACRRMIGVGHAEYQFDQLWPERRGASAPERPKGRVYRTLKNQRWVLARLRDAASLLTHFQCPNPLLTRVLLLHLHFGYREAERSVAAGERAQAAGAKSGSRP